MNFNIDQQSLKDLNILGKYQSDSIFNLFNTVKTVGGEKLLEKMFLSPLTDQNIINERVHTFKYIQQKKLEFPFNSKETIGVREYLEIPVKPNLISAGISIVSKKIAKEVVRSNAYEEEKDGLIHLLNLIKKLNDFLIICKDDTANPFQEKIATYSTFFHKGDISKILSEYDKIIITNKGKNVKVFQVIKWGHVFRNVHKDLMHELLDWINWLDVVIALTNVARERKMIYPKALSAEEYNLKAVNLKHPLMEKAIPNDLHFNTSQNVVFLTGANMAGKSTWMKTVGVSFYLAHMGFPVAADEFEFSVSDGLYSSINVPDNLAMGLSHFYAEVLRVKEVAMEVSKGKNLLILFDELFKGTNVKDAYDATLSVTNAFAKFTNCRYIISTHIIEVGEELSKEKNTIQFKYLPTIMEGNKPVYTRVIKKGITSDRQGMTIIKNEGILELIRG